jgi:hypothetical protein
MRSMPATRLMILATAAVVAAAAHAGGIASQAAVWKEQTVDFVYFGRTSRYSCDGIRDKLRVVLGEMGARRDIRALASGCVEAGERPGQLRTLSPSVHLVFSAPALPDPAVRPARPGDLAPLDAQYVPFTINADPFRNLQLGDCELVEEFARQVLPRLATRNLQQDITCVPYQLSGSHYSIRGEVLKALSVSAPAPGR